MPQRVDEREGRGHPVDVVDVLQALAAVVLLQDRPEQVDGLVLRPARIARILQEDDRDRALGGGPAARQRRDRHHVGGARDRVHDDERLPAELPGRRVGLDRELRRREHHQDVRLLRLQPRDLRTDVVVRDVVALLRDDLLLLGAEPVLEPARQLLAVVVVLEEDADLRLRPRPSQVAAVDRALREVARLVADRPRVLLVVLAPRARAARDEQVRHLQLVQVGADGEVRLRPERVVDREHLLVLDEVARLLDRLRRVVRVVDVVVLDLPAVDAAVSVHVLEVGVGALRHRGVCGGGPGQRRRAADQDLLRRHAGRRRPAGRRRRDDRERTEQREDDPPSSHSLH